MRFRKSKIEEAGPSIAPLIDIVFLLLIFFMVTSHFDVVSGVRIRLPQVAKKLFSEERNKIALVIDRSGQIYLEGKKLEPAALKIRLEQLSKESALIHLVLQADKDVKHGRVVQIMDLAKRAGIYSIIISAQWQTDKLL